MLFGAFLSSLPAPPPANAMECEARNAPYRFRGAGWFTFPDRTGPVFGVDVGDLDGNGIPDAVVSFGSDPPVLRSYLAGAPLCFSPGHDLQVPLKGRVFLTDATGDGALDAIVLEAGGEGRFAVFEGIGGGSFRDLASGFLGNTEPPAEVLVQDIDGDSRPDIVVAGRPSIIAYGPTFNSFQPFGRQSTASGVITLDADGDGDLDLLFNVAEYPWCFMLLEQKSRRAFEQVAISGRGSGPLYAIGKDFEGRAMVLDQTGDGFSSFVFKKTSDGWTAVETVLDSREKYMTSYLLGDLDGDGNGDLVTWYEDKILEVRFAEGPWIPLGEAPATEVKVTEVPGLDRYPSFHALRDLDGDGLRDIVVGDAYVLLEANRRLVASERVVPQPFEMAGSADLDGDGFADLVLASSNEFRTLLGRPGGLEEADRKASEGRVQSIAVGRPDPAGPVLLISNLGDRLEGREISPGGVIGEAFPLPFGGNSIHEVAFTAGGGERGDRYATIHGPGNSTRRILSFFEQASPGSFVESGSFEVPFRSRKPSTADLDGDGHQDVVLMHDDGTLVIRGGAAGFRPYMAAIPFSSAQTLAGIDLEGDGQWELLAGETNPPGAVLIRRSAAGVWESAPISSDGVGFIETADLNGDGRTDVLADARNGLQVFYNDGHGGLVMPPSIVPGRGGYYTEAPMVVLDMDGDGRPDVVWNRSITFGTGDGVGSAVELAGLDYYGPEIRTGDLNGDGSADLIAFYEWSPAEVFLGTESGRFEKVAPLPGSDTRAYEVKIADFDGDGRPDLFAHIVTQGPQWFRGQGDGTFAAPVTLPGNTYGFFAGDVDGDGAAELLAWGTGAGIFLYPGGETFAADDPVFLTEVIQGYPEAEVADLDGNGREDLILIGNDAGSRHRQLVFPGEPNGTLGDPIDLAGPLLLHVGSLFADLDGDGFLDTVRMDGKSLHLVHGNGDFTFLDQPLADFEATFEPLELRDVNGDGLLDIIGIDSNRSHCIAAGKEDGTFEEPVFFAPMSRDFAVDVNGDGLKDAIVARYVDFRKGAIHAVLASREHLLEGSRDYPFLLGNAAPGDFDGDGLQDLAVRAYGARAISLVAGNTERRLRLTREVAEPGKPDKQSPSLGAGDYDGDGQVDLLVLAGGTAYGYRARGHFAFADPEVLATEVHGHGISLADVDLDGTKDLFISGFSVARGIGGGAFAPPRAYGAAPSGGAPSILGDFDADGILDVAHASDSGVIFLSAGEGAGAFTAMEFLPSGADSIDGVALGDFNGDGIADMAVGGSPFVWYGREGKKFERGDPLPDPRGAAGKTLGLVAADLNRDGFTDLLSASPEGYILAYLGGEEGLQEAGGIMDLPEESTFIVPANFAGDGAVDVVAGGKNGIFLTLGAAAAGDAFVRGDANGDGWVDIADAIWMIQELFYGGLPSSCSDASDASDDGTVDLADAILLMSYQFLGGPAPAPPFPACGNDPTEDGLNCLEHRACGAP